MNVVIRTFVLLALAVSAWLLAAARPTYGARKPAPSPSPSASAAPLPTATPEPPNVAIPKLQAKIKANPADQESIAQLAGYELGLGRPDLALQLTQRLFSLGDKSAQTYYLDGTANENLGRIGSAVADFEQAANLEPTNVQVLLSLTQLYLRTGRPSEAERVAKRATAFNPNEESAFITYGLVLAQEAKYDQARAQFATAAKLAPADPQPLILEAKSYIGQKAYALAGSEYDAALALDSKNRDALLGKAQLQALNHDVSGSIATYETLRNVVPGDDAKAAVLVQEYTVYRDEKMMGQALATLNEAETLYPKVAAVHIAYGDYDAGYAKNDAAAEAQWKIALGPGNDNTDALMRLADLAVNRRRPYDAIGYVKRVTQVAPGDPNAWYMLGQMQSQNHDYDGARDAFRHSFSLQATPQALAGIATSDLALRNYSECTRAFQALDRNAIALMQRFPTLFLEYGRCAEGARDNAQARLAYMQVKPYVKPGTKLAADIDRALRRVSRRPSPKKAKPEKKTAKKA